ncbi:hypothetical protein [Curtobacterium sp. MCBD17_040]|uniref:hypothetical protein n=1 Tax=Curtobacterium sp. MCBD17_040 TaxID=2175674 RepID=UPI000DA6E07A|nr:hypothetical protein [Curtobacterium sp. MCBD17_040]WIB65925.1 hypothetical protein DEI94_17570 [Curtobacterium sp. MCBD17_040]
MTDKAAITEAQIRAAIQAERDDPTCSQCGGRGRICHFSHSSVCAKCGGTGMKPVPVEFR